MSTDKQKINKLILNYLIFEAYETTAYSFATQLGIDLHDATQLQLLGDSITLGLSSIKLRRQIKDSLFQGHIEDVINLLSLQRPDLLEVNDYLYFKILLLNLIEMIKQNTRENHSEKKHTEEEQDEFVLKVIEFAKSKLLNKVSKNSRFMTELELTMTLLLYCQNKESIPEKLNKLFKFKLKRDIFDLINKTMIVNDSRKGADDGRVDVGFFTDDLEDEGETEEEEEELETQETTYNGSDSHLKNSIRENQNIMTDSTLKKMVKLWIWAENKVNNPSNLFKLE